MFRLVPLSRCLKVVNCFKYARSLIYTRISHNVLLEAEGIVKQSPSCRNLSSSNVPPNETSLKESLLQSLFYIRSCNDAILFCGLLCEASLILENAERCRKHSDWEVEKLTNIFYNVKQLVTENRSIHIVPGRILERVYTLLPHDFLDRHTEYLLIQFEIERIESLDVTYENSIESLMKFIELLRLYFNEANKLNDLFPGFSSEDLLHNLEALASHLQYFAKLEANNLLDLIFYLGQKHSDLSAQHKIEIGNLMIDAIKPIEECVDDVKKSPPCSIFPALRKRSAIQFLIDEYAKFPSLKESLLVEFYRGKINNSRITLDNLLMNFYDDHDKIIFGGDLDLECLRLYDLKCTRGTYAYTERKDDYSAERRKQEGATMPESHSWWTTCK